MSVDATRWAWKQQGLRPIQKLVLLSLADHAGADQCAWPSYDRLKCDTGADRKTIWQALIAIKDAGLIVDSGRRAGATSGVIVWQLVGVDNCHSSSENGTVTARIDGEAVPFLPLSSSENGTWSSSENGTVNRPVEPTIEPISPSFHSGECAREQQTDVNPTENANLRSDGPQTRARGQASELKKRATRMTTSTDLPADWLQWALQERPGMDVERTFAVFRDYWIGNGKTKLDWFATWRNWVRRDVDFARTTHATHRDSATQRQRERAAERDEFIDQWMYGTR